MRSQKTLLDEALRSTDPLTGRGESRAPEGADELLASILASDPRDGVQPSSAGSQRGPVRARRRRLLAAAPLAVALLVALLAGLPGGREDERSILPVLVRAAEAAAAQAPIDSDLPYLYMKTRNVGVMTAVAGGRGWSVYTPETREQWIAKDGSGRVRTVDDPPRWVGAANREAWEASGRMPFLAHGWRRHVEEEDVPPGYFHKYLPGGEAFSDLPTDPADLAAWLEHRVQDPKAGAGAGNGFSVAVRTFALVAEILSNPFAPPQLRAALYEAEGLIPGVEYLGETVDQLGRRGVAVGAQSANSGSPTIYSLVFDPETSQVLATQEKILEAPAALPEEGYPRTESVLFLASGATSSIGDKPR